MAKRQREEDSVRTSKAWTLLSEILGEEPEHCGVEPMLVTFDAYILKGPAAVPAFEYAPKAYNTYAGVPYFRPDGWWQLQVKPFCAAGYEKRSISFQEIDRWPVAYHGTPCESLAAILKAALRKSSEVPDVVRRHGGCGAGPTGSIYLSPSLWYSSHPVYSKLKKLGPERWVQVVLKVRVRPGSYRTQRSTLAAWHWDPELAIDPNRRSLNGMEWLLDGNSLARSDAVVVGVMLREIGQNADPLICPNCPRLERTFEGSISAVAKRKGKGKGKCKGKGNGRNLGAHGPEYEWTSHVQAMFRQAGYYEDPFDFDDDSSEVYGPADYPSTNDGFGDDHPVRDAHGVSSTEAASRSAKRLDAPGANDVVSMLLAKFGEAALSGQAPQQDSALPQLRDGVVESLVHDQPTRADREAIQRYHRLIDDMIDSATLKEPLSLRCILQWHQDLMDRVHPGFGQLRVNDVRCGDYPRLPPQALCSAMVEYAQAATDVADRKDLSAAAKAAWCSYHLVRIHPFADGNGRLSRLMAIWALRRHGVPQALCLVPLFLPVEGDASRTAYIKAQVAACRGSCADTRELAAHICRCMVETVNLRIGLPLGLPSSTYLSPLQEASAASDPADDSDNESVASRVSKVLEYGIQFDAAANERPRFSRPQLDLLFSLAGRAWKLDPTKNPAASTKWAGKIKHVCVKHLKYCHASINPQFRNGKHQGSDIATLTTELRHHFVRPEDLPPLVGVKWQGSIWVVEGNRRLKALADFSEEAAPRVIVHNITDGSLRQFQAPLVAKLLLAMTTKTGGQMPRVRQRGGKGDDDGEDDDDTI
eukprot:TRINITY_DN30679_c0_g2_i1.p1 TRINITY_DN30679_c0_g2~~TRINITY_DN30679_c0_g2_i1.p1  ORF type:complete len:816 (-),score=84.49 TRINITY_DN30679_c0_g2_i1:113-2560(-)